MRLEGDIASLPMAVLDTACCRAVELFHHQEVSDPADCLEIFRRALELKQDAAWECLLNGCVGAEVRGRLVSDSAWRIARRYQSEEAYLTFAFTRFMLWHAGRVASDEPVRLDSFGGLLTLLHKCLHCALLEEMRIWSPPGTWQKKYVPATGGQTETMGWASPSFSGEPMGDKSPEDVALDREVLRQVWSCARGRREQRLIALRWYLGYPPREIVERWPQEYSSTREIGQMLQNILARYYRKYRQKHSEQDA
jgi:hypothetical protein